MLFVWVLSTKGSRDILPPMQSKIHRGSRHIDPLIPAPLSIKSFVNFHHLGFSPATRKLAEDYVVKNRLEDSIEILSGALIRQWKAHGHKYSPEKAYDVAYTLVYRLKTIEGKPLDFNHKPSPFQDTHRYYNTMTPKYKELLRVLSLQAGPMAPECRASICIPVAAVDEGPHIYRTLKSFLGQSAPSKSFEIALFVNCPKSRYEHPGVRNTLAEITRFKQNHPELQVAVCNATLRGGTVERIGFVRSVATEVPLIRHMERKTGNEHFLFRCDADTTSVHPEYVEHYLKLFDSHPKTDAFTGELRWSRDKYAEDPAVYLNAVLYDLLCAGHRIYSDKLVRYGGPNFAVRASMYAYVGGYREWDPIAEDINFRKALCELRNEYSSYESVAYAGSKSKLHTSTRRLEAATALGGAGIAQWTIPEIAFQEVDGVRRARHFGLRAANRDEQVAQFESLINSNLAGFTRFFEAFDVHSRAVEKVLGSYFGFEYEIKEDDRIKITNADEFFRRWESLSKANPPEDQ